MSYLGLWRLRLHHLAQFTPLLWVLEETSSQNRLATTSLPQEQPAGAAMDEQPGTSAVQSTNLTSSRDKSQPS